MKKAKARQRSTAQWFARIDGATYEELQRFETTLPKRNAAVMRYFRAALRLHIRNAAFQKGV